jgi:hypothetical protein
VSSLADSSPEVGIQPLAIAAEGQGDAKGQRQNIDAALANLKDIPWKVVFDAMLGHAYARAGFLDQAQRIAPGHYPVRRSTWL